MKISTLFFNGKILTLRESIPILMRQVIEEDVPLLPDYDKNVNPYKFLSEKLSIFKTRAIGESTVRNWCYEKDTFGACPALEDFFLIIQITKSKRILQFIGSLIDLKNSEEQALFSSAICEEIGDVILEMGAKLKNIASQFKDEFNKTTKKNSF
jgi:hypothetical protein